MPNYSLVTTAQFQPFSLERYLQPMQIYGQAYHEQEDALGQLETLAGVWENRANQQTDPETYAQYKKYADDLRAQAEQLASVGLTPSSRQAMLNMRKRYASEIVPIEEAWKRRELLAEEQRKLGPNAVFDFDASTQSLDWFLKNPTANYDTRDLSKITAESAGLFGTISKQLNEYSLTKDPNIKSKYYNLFRQQYGMTPEQAQQFMSEIRLGLAEGKSVAEITSTNPQLYDMFRTLYDKQGIDNWDNPVAQRRVAEAILSGVPYGVGQTSLQMMQDPEAMADLQVRTAVRFARAVRKAQEEEDAKKRGRVNLNPVALRNAKEVDVATKEVNKWKEKGYLTEDGKLTRKGKLASVTSNREANRDPVSMQVISYGDYELELTEFGNYLYKNSGYNAAKDVSLDKKTGKITFKTGADKQWKQSNVDQLASNVKEALGGYDVYRTTAYERVITLPAEEKAILKTIKSNQKGKDKYETVEYISNEKGFVKTGKIDRDVLDDASTSVTSVYYTPYGQVANLSTKDGDIQIFVDNETTGAQSRKALRTSQQLTTGIENGWLPITETNSQTGEQTVKTDAAGNVQWAVSKEGDNGWSKTQYNLNQDDVDRMMEWRDNTARMGVMSGIGVPVQYEVKGADYSSDDVLNYVDLLEGLVN